MVLGFTLATVTMFHSLFLEFLSVYTPWTERDCLSSNWKKESFRFGVFVFLAIVINGYNGWEPFHHNSFLVGLMVCVSACEARIRGQEQWSICTQRSKVSIVCKGRHLWETLSYFFAPLIVLRHTIFKGGSPSHPTHQRHTVHIHANQTVQGNPAHPV